MPRRPTPDVLDCDEAAALLEQAGPDHQLWILLGLDAGLRVGEICAITPDHVTPARGGVIHLRGKGGVLRRIPCSSRLLRALSIEDLHRAALRIPTNSPYVPRCIRTVQRCFKHICRQAGILVPGRCPHSLRHTYATRLVQAGVPLTSVQRVLGHASLATTQIYLHAWPGWEQELAASLDRWLHEGGPSLSHFVRNTTLYTSDGVPWAGPATSPPRRRHPRGPASPRKDPE